MCTKSETAKISLKNLSGLETFSLTGELKTGVSVSDYKLKRSDFQSLLNDYSPSIEGQILERVQPARRVVKLVMCQSCGESKAFCKMSKRCASVCKVCVSSLQLMPISARRRMLAKVQRNILRSLGGIYE